MANDVFRELITVNVNEHTEVKKAGGMDLTYLSWPWAWAEVKKRYHDANYTIWRNANGLPYVYDPLTGYMVFTSVTICGETHEMWLSVMDGANKAMKDRPYSYSVKNPNFKYAKLNPDDGKYYDRYGNEQDEYIAKSVDAASMTDINKTLMRCLVKNLAMFGLGLYIYAGEDLPEGEAPEPKPVEPSNVKPATATNADVEKVKQLPREEPKTPTPVQAYLLNEMATMRKLRGIDATANNKLFATQKDVLVKAGLAPDKPLEEYNMQEAKNLILAMGRCFDGMGTELIMQ